MDIIIQMLVLVLGHTAFLKIAIMFIKNWLGLEIHAKKESKIIGGEDAEETEITYQVSIRLSGNHMCGGAIALFGVTEVVITAAHCVDSGITHKYTIIAGDLRRSNTSGHEQCRSVVRIISHESYSGMTFANDIAIIFTDKPFNWTEHVRPIELPYPYQQTSGDVIISGWGTPKRWLSLGCSAVPIVDDETCMEAYASVVILESMLCAGFLGEGGKDTCQGDAGGPVVSVDGRYLAAVVSWGKGCADPFFPGVNTELSYYIDWIASHVGNHTGNPIGVHTRT
ncbi:Trypsin-1 [Orchesella cincta]|uniref:Trypsin-1 n=1 Tax=Orchesella cincta TaxID=48709 RepID=A0A1D2N1Y3_ORCCI|nr:Trypsin-1 [Orchesella cincta]